MDMLALSTAVGRIRNDKFRLFLFSPSRLQKIRRFVAFSFVLIVVPIKAEAISLEECIFSALKKNPGTRAAFLRVDAAKAMIEQVAAASYPQLFLSGNYSLTDNPTQAFMMQLNQRQLDIRDPDFDPNNPDDTDNLRISVELKYRIYDGGKRKIRSTMAELGKEAAAQQLAAVQNDLIHQVTRSYYGVLQLQDFTGVQKETIKSLEENLRVARERFRAGSAVKTDVLNLEVRLAQAHEDLIRAQNGVRLAIAALNTAIGEDLVGPEGLPIPVKKNEVPPPIEQGSNMVENRPELHLANRQTSLKEKEYQKAIREYYPNLNAFGSYDFDSDFDELENSYIIGIMAKWELFDGFRRPNTIKQTKSEWQAAQKDEQNIRNNLRLDLQRAEIQAVEAWQRLDVARKSVESAEESLRITRVRYKEGATDITELLTAQVGLTASQTRDVAAYYDYLIALSNVKRAQGGLVAEYTDQN